MEEITAALQDFNDALQDGVHDGLSCLQSWAEELHEAPEESLKPFYDVYSSHLNEALLSNAVVVPWAAYFSLKEFLNDLFEQSSCSALGHSLQTIWSASLSAAVLNSSEAEENCHLEQLWALRGYTREAIQGVKSRIQAAEAPLSSVETVSLIRSAAYLLALFQNDPGLDYELETILLAVAPLSPEHSPAAISLFIATAFETILDVAQSQAGIAAVSQLSPEHKSAYFDRLWSCLSVFRRVSSSVADLWWGVYGACIFQVGTAVRAHGHSSALEAIVKTLCHPDSAAMLLQLTLANPACGEGAAEVKAAFRTAQALLQDHPAAMVSACCDVLLPHTNAGLLVRLEALAALKSITEADSEQVSSAWSDSNAVSTFLYSLSHDPSVRIRRKSIDLLAKICQAPHFEAQCERGLQEALLRRCMDKDIEVRKAAFCAIEALPWAKLAGTVSTANWRVLLDRGLGEIGERLNNNASRTAKEIAACSGRLLERYLNQDGSGARLRHLQELINAGGKSLPAHFLPALGRIMTEADLQDLEG